MSFSLLATVGVTGASSGTSTAINTTGANLIVVCLTGYLVVGAPPTDSESNTWTAAVNAQTLNSVDSEIWYCYSPTTSASHTFSLPVGSTAYMTMSVSAWSGAQAAPLDQTASAVDNLSVTSGSAGSITPSANGALIIGSICPQNSSFAPTINDSFSIIESSAIVGGVSYSGASAYLVQGSAAAINPTWSFSSSPYGACIASFLPTSGGGSGGRPRVLSATFVVPEEELLLTAVGAHLAKALLRNKKMPRRRALKPWRW